MSNDGTQQGLRVLADLVDQVQGADDLTDAAGAVVALARDNLDCDYAGITITRQKGLLESLAVTDPIVEKADELQYQLREGPCVDAVWEQRDFAAPDIATDPRWPNWGRQAAALGLSSLLAVRMTTPDRVVGALNLYAARPRSFADDDVAFAHVFAHQAAVALSSARTISELMLAVDGRTLVGQAQGILMERFALTPAQSFAVLRRYSQDSNIKLRDVAQAIVASGDLPMAPDPRGPTDAHRPAS